MPSPFPGMDPYLEGDLWLDVVPSLSCRLRKSLVEQLPRRLVARLAAPSIEIREAPLGKLVTDVRFVLPWTKVEPGRAKYLRARRRLMSEQVHLLELDLLRYGRRSAEDLRLPASDYLITLVRAGSERMEAWPFSLRDPVPVVPVPLSDGEADIRMDIGAGLRALYDEVSYDLSIDYTQPPPPPELSPEDAAWVRSLTQG